MTRTWHWASLFLLFAFLWAWRLQSGHLNLQPGQQVKISATIRSEPSIKSYYQLVWVPIGSQIIGIQAPLYPRIHYGDYFIATGRLQLLSDSSNKVQNNLSQLNPLGKVQISRNLRNPTPGVFITKFSSPRWWLKADQLEINPIYCSSSVENHQPDQVPMSDFSTSPAQDEGRSKSTCRNPESFLKSLTHLRQRILHLFLQALPQDEAALLTGMVLGSKQGLSPEFYSALQTSGTLHVVVASGMNVMLIAGATASLFTQLFRRQWALIFALISIWLYIFIAGFDPPLIRAGLMGSLSFVGLILGRLRQAGRLLIFSAIAMLAWRPVWLFDVGFQLSVIATAGLIWISPLLKPSKQQFVIARLACPEPSRRVAIPWESISKPPRRFFAPRFASAFLRMTSKLWHYLASFPLLGDSLVTTLAAQIAVWPILAFHFHTLSLISPLTNALVLWIVAPVTQLGMLIGLLSILFESLTSILIWITWPLLAYFTSLVRLANHLPVNITTLESFSPYLLIFYYLSLIFLIQRLHVSNSSQVSSSWHLN